MKRKESTIQAMWRTIKLWMVIRELQKRCNTTYTRKESKLIRQGKRQYLDRVEFSEDIAKSMANWTFYQKLVPKFHFVVDKPERFVVDEAYLLVESLLDSAINREKPLIDLMSTKTGVEEDSSHIRTSCHGDEFCGLSDLIMELVSKYSTIWIPVASAVSFIVGIIAS